VILPRTALQVTVLLVVEPATVALNGSVPPVVEFAVEGVMVTEETAAPELGLEVEVIVTVATADLVGSATLVAVTVATPEAVGAVNSPYGVIVPAEALQFTLVFAVVPWTDAVNWNLPEVATLVAAGAIDMEETGAELEVDWPLS
jgi:hypothetical protein